MILIQKLLTRWTKASRGSPGAGARASAGYHYPLPSHTTEGVAFYQHAVFDERHGFDPRLAREELLSEVPASDLGVEFEATLERLRVFYAWSPACGAPERTPGKRDLVLDISIGAWGRFIHNGRFAHDEAPWSYQQVVYNVAVVRTFSASLFDARPPTTTANRIANLR